MQLAAAVSMLANRGTRFMPTLLLAEQKPGKTLLMQQPIPLETIKLRDPTDWDRVIQAMQEVIESPQGTAHPFFGPHDYTVAGKTGTAQIVARRGSGNEMDNQLDLPEKLRDHHLFIAFAPVDHPIIALAVITENSNAPVQVAQTVLDYYLGKYQHVH
jgi:penicillin-binding protein 2